MDAKEKAIYYLNIKPRTKKQIVDYLKEKGYENDDIYEAVDQLESYNYIDDVEFSRMYFQYGFEKGRGRDRIVRELAQKGVSPSDIEAGFFQLEDVPDEWEMAVKEVNGIIGNIDTEELDFTEKQKLRAKIVRRLAYRGFSMETAYKAAATLVK